MVTFGKVSQQKGLQLNFILNSQLAFMTVPKTKWPIPVLGL